MISPLQCLLNLSPFSFQAITLIQTLHVNSSDINSQMASSLFPIYIPLPPFDLLHTSTSFHEGNSTISVHKSSIPCHCLSSQTQNCHSPWDSYSTAAYSNCFFQPYCSLFPHSCTSKVLSMHLTISVIFIQNVLPPHSSPTFPSRSISNIYIFRLKCAIVKTEYRCVQAS